MPSLSSAALQFDESQLKHINDKLSTLEPHQILQWASITFGNLFQETAFGPSGNVISDMLYAHGIAVPFDESQLKHINDKLSTLEPHQILQWASITFGNLFQETAFGPSGNVISDMLYAHGIAVPVIFVDTLHHFDETLDLAKRSQERFGFKLHVFKPEGCDTREEFTAKYGQELWKNDDVVYDYTVKVEPARRAYEQLDVQAVITGRRRSQKGDRASLQIIEVEQGTGLVKINPLASWSFQQVWTYLRASEVPYNALLDQGYKSIGDYHSTRPVKEGEDERAGRWAGTEKTECGLHKDYFAMRASFLERKKKEQERATAATSA
ncbi:3'-phosphoadenylsulfate reductase [Dipsacomyces acuminosporus]|nr:3'-phosphoadenylsulfate reductase [Dipsacomyces acuminosporus]